MKWSPEEDRKLSRLWDDGLSASQISREFGGEYSRSAVISRAHRIQLPARDSSVNRHLSGWTSARAAALKPARPKLIRENVPVEEPPCIGVPGEFEGCKWPVGEPSAMLCCGQPRHQRSSWCLHHRVRATQPAKKDQPDNATI